MIKISFSSSPSPPTPTAIPATVHTCHHTRHHARLHAYHHARPLTRHHVLHRILHGCRRARLISGDPWHRGYVIGFRRGAPQLAFPTATAITASSTAARTACHHCHHRQQHRRSHRLPQPPSPLARTSETGNRIPAISGAFAGRVATRERLID